MVVANANDKASVALAKFYLEKRNIPEANLFLVKTSRAETIDWDEFVKNILNPLREQLVASGWIKATLSGREDPFGRTELTPPFGHNIDFIVGCRLPLRISKDATRAELEAQGKAAQGMQTNEASVDGELSLLAARPTRLMGPLPNPLAGKAPTLALIHGEVVRVARLDGPSGWPERMIETGLLAEQIGLRGMAYIDLGHRHPSGDEWLKKAGELLAGLHYPVITEPERRLMSWQDRVDGAAFYFGWYADYPRGPMGEAGYMFAPGALGWHIYSFTASRIRGGRAWAPQVIRSGITGTVGNVYEPYLHLTHRPDLFVQGLVAGMSAGEAAYFSLPALSWMCLYAGDPLYRPLAVDLDTQLAQIEAEPDSPGAQYVVLRQAERLHSQSGAAAALKYLEGAAQKVDGFALSFTLARKLADDTEERRAVGYLEPFLQAETFSMADTPLAWQAAELLVELRQREQGLEVMKKILAIEDLGESAWLVYAPAAVPLARQYGQAELAEAWEAKVAQIKEKRAEEARKRAEARAAREAKKKAAENAK